MIPPTHSYSVALALAWITYVWNWNAQNLSRILDDSSLWVGNIASAWDSTTLRAHGITHIVSITQFGDAAKFYPDEFVYHVVDLQDEPDADIRSTLADGVEFIRRAIDGGHRVLVHCNQGRSRSVTMAAAFLATHRGMTPGEALVFIRSKRAEACPNPGFVGQLHAFAESNAP